ncbi:MAG: hypothetical protein LW715_03365 [Rhodobacter sp.]|nr:hypothetical protein [Rhodobacter sp.]
MTLLAALAAELAGLARYRETISYGALARRLAIPGPGSITTLTGALEALMAEDAAADRPFRAALCEGKLRGGLPAPGFFEAARRLGRFAGPLDGPEAEAFVADERGALFARYADQT